MWCAEPAAGKLAKARELGAEIVVIDTPPHADAMARQAARLADLILIPWGTRAFDLAAIEATAELVKSMGTPAFLVFNAGPPRASLIYKDAADLITKGFGLPIAPVVLPERADFHHSAPAGNRSRVQGDREGLRHRGTFTSGLASVQDELTHRLGMPLRPIDEKWASLHTAMQLISEAHRRQNAPIFAKRLLVSLTGVQANIYY